MQARFLPAIALVLALLISVQATPVDPVNFSESVYVSDANIGSITGIDWAPDGSGRLFVIRKGGFSGIQNAEVRIVQNGIVLATPFATETPDLTRGKSRARHSYRGHCRPIIHLSTGPDRTTITFGREDFVIHSLLLSSAQRDNFG